VIISVPVNAISSSKRRSQARDRRGHVVAAPSHNGAVEHALPGFRGGAERRLEEDQSSVVPHLR
jgi:hypothetical protein